MKVLVIGASLHHWRVSNEAVQLLKAYGHDVTAVGRDEGSIGDVPVLQHIPNGEQFDTVTIYLNPGNQKEYYTQILDIHPRRIIFNPGAENTGFEKLANENGIITEEACTLVLLRTRQF